MGRGARHHGGSRHTGAYTLRLFVSVETPLGLAVGFDADLFYELPAGA